MWTTYPSVSDGNPTFTPRALTDSEVDSLVASPPTLADLQDEAGTDPAQCSAKFVGWPLLAAVLWLIQTVRAAISYVKIVRVLTQKTANYSTVSATDDIILVDATAGAVTITLDDPATNGGKELTVKKTDASGNAVTVSSGGTGTIDGGSITLATQYAAVTAVSDGLNYWMIAKV